MPTDRAEHMQWAKARALEYVDVDPAVAVSSFMSDLTKWEGPSGAPILPREQFLDLARRSPEAALRGGDALRDWITSVRLPLIRSPDGHTAEFDCVDCGQYIIAVVHREGWPALCGMCLHSPGWFRNPELRALLDPEGWVDPSVWRHTDGQDVPPGAAA